MLALAIAGVLAVNWLGLLALVGRSFADREEALGALSIVAAVVVAASGGFDYTLRGLSGNERRGRGLAIVDALVTHWGIRRGSTQVWFVMRLAA